MSQTVKVGDSISVEYTGTLEDGEVFDTSKGKQPLSFEVGSGQLIPGFDQGVIGMAVGDQKTVTIAPENAYGERREDLIIPMPIANVPADITLEIGMALQLTDKSGRPIPAIVTEIGEENVSMDVNHPLAGKVLTFAIEVVGINA